MLNQASNTITALIAAGYALILAAAFALAARGQNEAAKSSGPEFTTKAPETGKEYIFAIHPLHKFSFGLPYPHQTLNSLKHGYHVIGKMGDDNKFTGVIQVRRDNGVSKVNNLKCKSVSYPVGTTIPQYNLQTHGPELTRDFENRHVRSQESSIMNVYFAHVAG
ncbi:MAG: hypothetical protein HY938_01110 [Nitrosomonadales bacterium]|nr:hypothetical protein [Nitrosomonadales bacterium]